MHSLPRGSYSSFPREDEQYYGPTKKPWTFIPFAVTVNKAHTDKEAREQVTAYF